MKKIYVIDTNVFIHNPDCISKFDDNDVAIPFIVIEELDGLKKAPGEKGYSARCAIRNINRIRKKGDILKGIEMENGGKLFCCAPTDADLEKSMGQFPAGWRKDKPDNIIFLTVLNLQKKMRLTDDTRKVILVTNDCEMLIKADSLKIPAQEFLNDRIEDESKLYKGRITVCVPDAPLEKFYADNKLELTEDVLFTEDGNEIPTDSLYENEYMILKSWQGNKALAKYCMGSLYRFTNLITKPYGITPKNAGQAMLLEALLGESPLVICNGPAGTGKTLLAVACGLEQVTESRRYKNVLVCRPNVTMDEEIGFLPGTEAEKISPLLRGVYDNLARLLGNPDDDRDKVSDKISEVFQRGWIKAESIAYLRGRSIADTFIIIDECQNATPAQILSIITRAGKGSKIVLLGDINQIDNIHLDGRNNALVHAIEKMKGSRLCEIVSFTEDECIRSELAKEASMRLKLR